MKGKRYSPEQIVKILREGERAESVREVARQHGVSEQTFYRWKKVYAGMEVSDLRRFKGLQTENGQLKKLVADQALKISLLEEVNSKKW
ncbi:MAG TPA: transposase [Candidatus Angelobacter sp.]|jgi:putative transposase|nr:transposase [Candidatus Angelobacter sp.]